MEGMEGISAYLTQVGTAFGSTDSEAANSLA